MSDPIRVSTPGGQVITIDCGEGSSRTVGDVLEEQGIDASTVTMMVNGQPTTLDQVLTGGESVVAASAGKGATA